MIIQNSAAWRGVLEFSARKVGPKVYTSPKAMAKFSAFSLSLIHICRHAGFGLGFERMVMYLTGVSNIRDVELHPRTVGSAEF